eukprot:TRINITY_DN2946_c0_g1_i10.p1 TRINITY_DN2946_c0_g1~~TRINITY_DN2946_c0_g1_i10.p1  ORF type:complete len:392 (-),score=76.32 TRINITY_DN2946_c0_g1_i10:246-1421(-)
MFTTLKLCTGCRKNVVPVLENIVRQNVGCLYRGLQTETDRVALPLRPLKGKSERDFAKRFYDYREVKVSGGDGGDGNISFLSVNMIEFAGPDGGNGGHGGHLIFTADPGVKDFSHLTPLLNAPCGGRGRNKNMHGKDAEHRYIKVPKGTIVKNLHGEIVCDLEKPGSMFIAAKGGAGGKGNAHFKNSVDQAPKVAEAGGKAEMFIYALELRTMADVGFIGFPNAGKSTLLQAISRARPKVAAYPFTTVNPHIGMVQYDDLTQLAVADLPGLIRGSSKNRGLGYAFLQHVQRCRLLVYVIDLSADDPLDQLDALKHELEEYETGLSEKPSIVLANKTDMPYSEAVLEELHKTGLEVMLTSGRTGKGLEHFLTRAKVISDEFVEQLEDQQENT